ncbi:MAG TPA: ribosome small subunit-dependent GTPase A [Polyangiaceae bacterium]
MRPSALELLGWSDTWAQAAAQSDVPGQPGRVIEAGRSLLVQTEADLVLAEVRLVGTGRSRPVCGDWVIMQEIPSGRATTRRGLIREVLPRRGAIARRKGEARKQTLVANVDAAWVVCGLDRAQGMRSLQRYQLLTHVPGIEVLIVLNKLDAVRDLPEQLNEAQRLAPNLPVMATSCTNGTGVDRLSDLMVPGRTIALLGPSGVGKSSLFNALVSMDVQSTGEVRASDRRGRHTTSTARLTFTRRGAQLVDTPGLRELGFWSSVAQLTEFFGDIQGLSQSCRFGDCQHRSEPGCAVRAALEHGTLAIDRYLTFLELSEECCDG